MAAQQPRAWECIVCGFVHEGPEPPDSCPVCGAPRSEFRPVPDRSPAAPPPAVRWRCLTCGYTHTGEEPPDVCPDCGAGSDRFERIEGVPAAAAAPASQGVRVVIVGGGIAGFAAAEAIRTASTAAEVTLISREPCPPYQRLNLTRYLAGEVTADDLPLRPPGWYEQRNIRLMLGAGVEEIDADRHALAVDGGRRIAFDRLILATGATAAVPPIPGVDAANVRRVRTIEDARRILELARPGTRCVCIGGGILGLEAAGAIARRGAEVTVIENFGWLLPRQLNERAARLLEKRVAQLGIALRYRANVAEIAGGAQAREVRLQDGSALPADLVILATGIRPDIGLARACGLAVNRGILVNDYLETSGPDVLAAGDAAEHRGEIYGLWIASQAQGAIAGQNAIGLRTPFYGIPRSNFLKVLGLDLFSIGVVEPGDAGGRAVDHEADGNYLRFVLRDNRLVGAILLGDTRAATFVKAAVEQGTDLGEHATEPLTAARILAVLESGRER